LQLPNWQFTIVRVLYRGFPSKLHHDVPSWVEDGVLFHIRIAVDRQAQQRSLAEPTLAKSMLDSAKFYHEKERWFITLFLLMPDHLHMLVAFYNDQEMSRVIGEWKHFHARKNGVLWQQGYFDHRLRDDERGEQLSMKVDYIRANPVVAGLCGRPEDWPWVLDSLA
jgi:putative transposase